MHWNAITRKELIRRVDHALNENASYGKGEVIGTPATYLDQKEFYPDASFLEHAPFLKTLIANPNHIGCHTLGKNSSPIFKGTQAIEKELIALCAEEIFEAPRGQIDGYVATGGTEANIEALWIYRNYFMQEYRANPNQIGVLFSEDTHYSISKGCDLLLLPSFQISVNDDDRQINVDHLKEKLLKAKTKGVKYFIVILNLSTTMFGSVDEIDPVVELLEQKEFLFKLHIDAAFGGFIYPFTHPNSKHNFNDKRISSVSIDAHKMLQTPYGTGIFLIKKGYMQYVTNTNAQYVPGLDYTLCGSRSGANAVAIWMLLMNYGSKGWTEKMQELLKRTDYLCQELTQLGIQFYRNPFLNIVTIKASQISSEIAARFELVADSYENHPFWWKVVVMDHVNIPLIQKFISELKKSLVPHLGS